ncbi:hypothetical protein M413DRAFT_443241 [Hebeloma cylindrosporum]|uniref:Signal peptidase complex subunit 1 n=1 Tax=Hebeloma cylindrosporum TaxID=76867 RepID=A0A0C3CKB5_HEBCY|nr:hypothetical protein M413DRAFT_443241 [Hebeloma cylindrosporum h7]
MSSFIQEITEGKIDFEGQHLVDLIAKSVLSGSAVVGFLVGFALQDLRVTFGIMALATLTLTMVLLPPWPMFNRHPVKWLPSVDTKAKAE